MFHTWSDRSSLEACRFSEQAAVKTDHELGDALCKGIHAIRGSRGNLTQ